MGKAKLQAELGLNTKQEAEDLFNQYHESVPFVRDLMNFTSRRAQTGSIGTLLGRRCRFNKWEPNKFGMHKPMELEEAERTYGRKNIRRAFISVKSDEEAKKIIEIMENAVSLTVPNKVDYESGDTWGDING
jgi:DNA polymerase I-like protein with 3'-5' exonuclease and polymerase domains